MAASRTGPCATSGATFIDWPFVNRASRYSSNEVQSRSMPQSSSYPMVTTFVSSLSGDGAGPCPQFPITLVVRPCRTPLWARPSTYIGKSAWLWTSMNPGDTAFPAASNTRAASTPPALPTISTRPPSTATSPTNGGLPEPSNAVAFLTTKSIIRASSSILTPPRRDKDMTPDAGVSRESLCPSMP